jgi:hypothetical protein
MKFTALPVKLMSVIIFGLMTFSVNAKAKNHCICETGTYKKERPFYRLGCRVWFKGKRCHTKQIVDINFKEGPLTKVTEELEDGDTLKIAFVGHWNSSRETISYLESLVVPIFAEKNIDVIYDNTACSPMSSPADVQNYLMELDLNDQQSLTVLGAQDISVGLWDPVLIGRSNFYAKASTKIESPTYPTCKEFEGKMCIGRFQLGATGECIDDETDELIQLTCTHTNATARIKKPKIHRWIR